MQEYIQASPLRKSPLLSYNPLSNKETRLKQLSTVPEQAFTGTFTDIASYGNSIIIKSMKKKKHLRTLSYATLENKNYHEL